MAYIKKLLTENFLYYASYVIKDRAIPELEDGLKPVQRRILHSLFEMDDGKFHKVANVVGHCMKYHPHGDQSIGSALVVLANKGLFIETQGNFGNPVTGDEASAPRYIECKCSQFAKDVFYNPKITEYVDSYDGRNREPVMFPAKIPVVLLMGAEGIAVGMSTRILPHNPVEVLKAEIACLRGQSFSLLPDFPTGGVADCTEYEDGNGRIRVRASLDVSDPKRIVIREVPFGVTTEALIASIEEAVRAGHLKIVSISDFTTDKVEIELKLARGVYSQEVVDALYAFTLCEVPISVNCLVIRDEKPAVLSVSEIVRHHAGRLLTLLRRELEIEGTELRAELFARTLERIFIEERIYKRIEDKKTSEAVIAAVLEGFRPFVRELAALKGLSAALQAESAQGAGKGAAESSSRSSSRSKGTTRGKAKGTELKDAAGDRQAEGHKPAKLAITDLLSADDIERLLKIPIRRISLYDIERAKEEMVRIQARLEEVERRLGNLVEYAIGVLEGFIKQLKADWPRKTRIEAFGKVAVKQVARRDVAVRYDGESGYLGTEVSGEKLLEASRFDRLLVLRQNGIYSVVPVPERLFVGKGLLWATVAEKERVSSVPITLVYRLGGNGVGGAGGALSDGAYIKRTVIDAWITGKDYSLVPEGAEILGFALGEGYEFALLYQPKPRTKKDREVFHADDTPIRSRQAQGIRLTDRVVVGLEVVCAGRGQSMNLQFDADDTSSATTPPSLATPQPAEKPSRTKREPGKEARKPKKAVKKEARKAANSQKPTQAHSIKQSQAPTPVQATPQEKQMPAVEPEPQSSSVPQPAKGGLLKAALEVAKKGKLGQQDEH